MPETNDGGLTNADRKRIVIIATHQKIDEFKRQIENDYKFKNFEFIRGKEEREIHYRMKRK